MKHKWLVTILELPPTKKLLALITAVLLTGLVLEVIVSQLMFKEDEEDKSIINFKMEYSFRPTSSTISFQQLCQDYFKIKRMNALLAKLKHDIKLNKDEYFNDFIEASIREIQHDQNTKEHRALLAKKIANNEFDPKRCVASNQS